MKTIDLTTTINGTSKSQHYQLINPTNTSDAKSINNASSSDPTTSITYQSKSLDKSNNYYPRFPLTNDLIAFAMLLIIIFALILIIIIKKNKNNR